MIHENIWEHHRGGSYIIEGFGIEEATLTPIVIYRPLNGTAIWTRPCEEFFDGRFRIVGTVAPKDEPELPLDPMPREDIGPHGHGPIPIGYGRRKPNFGPGVADVSPQAKGENWEPPDAV